MRTDRRTTEPCEVRGAYRLRLVQIGYGTTGVAALTAVNCALCAYIARRDRGKPIDLDRGAAVLALTVLTATLAGMYTAVFALPAMARVGARSEMRTIPWAVAAVPWLVVIALSPLLLGRDPHTVLNYIDTVGPLVLVVAAYPLVIRARDSTGSAAVGRQNPI